MHSPPTAEQDPPETENDTNQTVAQARPDVDALIAEYDEERPQRQLTAKLNKVIVALTFAVSLFVLYQVFYPQSKGNQYFLIIFLALILPFVFVCYRTGSRKPSTTKARKNDNPSVLDWTLAVVSFIVCIYPVLPISIGKGGGGFDAFLDRQGLLTPLDIVMGTLLTLLILEAVRRTTGMIMPLVCIAFFAYAYYGGLMPQTWAISHAGVDFDQIINGFYNDASGFYGTPLDVCATYIVLFTIYGAVLDATGAGRFFIDVSFAAFRRSKTAPGRTVTLSGFLLGTVSGSGTATAVSLGAVAWPILKRAGYPKEAAGGLLAAAGIGAILSPPTLGAAAFIIAEFLQTSYLTVLLWATIPTILYYVGIILAVEIDARKFGAKSVDLPERSALKLIGRFGYHFLSLIVIVVFLALDIPPFKAVVYASVVAAAFGLIERLISRGDPLDPDFAKPEETGVPAPERASASAALVAYLGDLYHALSSGIRSVLPVAAVCAAAGIITSVIAKTGLGLTLGNILVKAAKGITEDPTGVLILTAIFAAVAVTILGLAVPVTASFIISWVIFGPALQTLGVSGPETAMFIFYYAVLSEVSPPTALAAVASSAITGGNAIKTMWQTWKYTLPAFLAPLAFVITDNGSHLLMQGNFISIVWTTAVSIIAVAALAAITGGWIFDAATWYERLLCVPGALLLLYLQPLSIGIGMAFLVVAVALNFIRTKTNTSGLEATL
ncbi:TRAP transporter 4TM/12TM fusion protein [Antricoccus suffuscus]|uniref:TRAP transporter 4TM/12TM fusion protein n=1 Tax=Antricoccus suffuscus TaxID=1629062 RepID=A0A2T0Z8T8_9ACTN|nr:TRAP transporter fused permease subunit [Antricoccus suffuscus]PRZ32762.1 TRAP transporter 4TM/12TM fusion protein [Antricoccus suffuscus]